MQRRSLWLILVGGLVVLCLAVGAVGAATYQYLRSSATTATSAEIRATATARSAATSTPRSSTPTAVATQQPAPIATSHATATPAIEPTPTLAAATSAAAQPAPAGDVAASLISTSRAASAARPGASLYRISATLDPAARTITGRQTVRYTNTEDTALNDIYFRLWVNAPHYNEGGIEVTDVQIAGNSVQAALSDNNTTLKLPLAQPLAPQQSTEISMAFTTTAPSSGGGYGIFNVADGVFTLYNWHPELAVYENGAWLLNPVSDQGDPTNTDAANYEVTFAAPVGFTIVTGGVTAAENEADGQITQTSVAALARNFVVVAGDQLERVEQRVGETTVASYYQPGFKAGGEAALQTAVKSLELFSKQFGPFPYTEMDVAQVALGSGAGGMESTGLIMINSQYYDPEAANVLGNTNGVIAGAEGANVLAFTTAHEIAHQWWYGVIGSDAYNDPWLDESLTNWSAAYYVDESAGAEAGLLARDAFISLSYRGTLADGDVKLDQPVDAFSGEEYGAIVYGKGALLYDVLRAEIGDDAFFAFLQRYYREQQFDRATDQEWLNTLNTVAGRDMTPFFNKWVAGNKVRPADLPPGGPLSQMLSP